MIRQKAAEKNGHAPEPSGKVKQRRSGARRSVPSFLMSLEETAHYLQISEPMVRIEARAGNLPTVRFGRRILVVRHLLEEMLVAQAASRLTNANGTVAQKKKES